MAEEILVKCQTDLHKHTHDHPLLLFCTVQRFFFFNSHVSIGSQHISHVSGVGKLPAIDVLYDYDGLVRCRGWLHDISFDVLDLNLLTEPSVVHPITNITGAWLGFICHLLTDRIRRTVESQLDRGIFLTQPSLKHDYLHNTVTKHFCKHSSNFSN